MVADQPISVWNEIRVTAEGIGITLYSEAGGGERPVVEDETWLTFDELQAEKRGSIMSLRLTDESRESLRQEEDDPLPQVGDVVADQNPPSWAEHTLLEVVEVMPDVTADEYVIGGAHEREGPVAVTSLPNDKTVADVNPSYDADEPVVLAVYMDDMNPDGTHNEDDVYAFPASRLK